MPCTMCSHIDKRSHVLWLAIASVTTNGHLQGFVRGRYTEKLHLVELENSDDPYNKSNSSNFTGDLALWSAV